MRLDLYCHTPEQPSILTPASNYTWRDNRSVTQSIQWTGGCNTQELFYGIGTIFYSYSVWKHVNSNTLRNPSNEMCVFVIHLFIFI